MFLLVLIDVDECFPDQISAEYKHLSHNCHVDANCSSTKGSFSCTCHTGYSGDGVTCIGKMNGLAIFHDHSVSLAIKCKHPRFLLSAGQRYRFILS